MKNRLRYNVGRLLMRWGAGMLPLRVQRGVAVMCAAGMAWRDANPDEFKKALAGEDVTIRVVSAQPGSLE